MFSDHRIAAQPELNASDLLVSSSSLTEHCLLCEMNEASEERFYRI
jgi:hypothetical protein